MSKFILLIMLVSLAVLSPLLVSANEPATQACISCHQLEFAQWRLSPHNLPEAPVTCTTCHNEHDGVTPAGLRLPEAELCVSCHSSDPQQLMLTGKSPFAEITTDYSTASQNPHNTAESCVTCHMAVTSGRITVGGHTMQMVDSSGKKNTAACAPCHSELSDFNLNDRQREVAERLALLADHLADENTQARQVYQFVKTDGSLGIHNPGYAIKLLTDASREVGAPDWVSRPSAELSQEDDVCSSCKW